MLDLNIIIATFYVPMYQTPQGMVGKMAQDVGMVQKYCGVPTLLGCFFEIHHSLHLFSFENFTFYPHTLNELQSNKPAVLIVQGV